MDSFSYNKGAEIIQALNSTSRYLDDLLNIDHPYFEGMMRWSYPTKHQFNKANASDSEDPFMDFHLSISNGLFHQKIYIKIV